ncbi:hypothetical protein A2419_00320 [Candidatus Adlerbacteria bacterium RIFOXYC1_FULL_48_26]|uniref:Aminotransferase class V domain-containing protein n=1 Tax=Candidatus Adlerbacteria bacterium RIFOXYC1_FULL_48_26 TaxID=1797247 RepID=A0A1F4Y2U7_9BACT|nr:MAG: hypothetical protein A2419_00320 [Candidatus Adlerbacteria bacterium RIFOXYC1_FULL_48_26]
MWFRKKRIYADAAAATPLSARARGELLRLLDVYGNAGAIHSEAVAAKKELDDAREMIASSIGAHADEMIFSASGTESNNIAIHGVLRPLLQKHGELHAITLAIEHQSVLEPLRALKAEGLTTTELGVDSEGFVSLKDLEEAITDKTVFVSVQMVNSEVGTVEPIQEIAKLIRRIKKNRQEASTSASLPLYLHTDASQAPLWLPLRVEKLGIDLLTLDAQKVLGPKGIGALYIKRSTVISPVIRGGVQERGLRGGTPNVPLAGSFAVAMQDAAKDVEMRASRVAETRDYLLSEIKKRIPEVVVNGPTKEGRVANNLNIAIPGLDAEMAVIGLDAEGIAVSTRSACNTGDESPSHVIQALGTPRELLKNAVRITLLPDATKGDVVAIAVALEKIAKRYKTTI